MSELLKYWLQAIAKDNGLITFMLLHIITSYKEYYAIGNFCLHLLSALQSIACPLSLCNVHDQRLDKRQLLF